MSQRKINLGKGVITLKVQRDWTGAVNEAGKGLFVFKNGDIQFIDDNKKWSGPDIVECMSEGGYSLTEAQRVWMHASPADRRHWLVTFICKTNFTTRSLAERIVACSCEHEAVDKR